MSFFQSEMSATQVMDQAQPAALEPLFIKPASDKNEQDGYRQQPLALIDTRHQQKTPQLKDHNSNSDANHQTCNDHHRQQQQQHHHQANQQIIGLGMEKVFMSAAEDQEADQEQVKCSAVHSLERDMPDFDYSHLVVELRERILNDCKLNEGLYAQKDIDKCKHDRWFVERFLLRQKLDLDKAFDMLKRTMRFRNESLAHSIRREDFPAEFYQVGGLFCYEDDRKGNKMLYIRLKIHRKIPEIQLVLQAFLFYNIDYLDVLANGRGIALVLDCTGAGLANADMEMLMFLVSTLVNYFPKGMSYLLVHELPWILKPFWHIAKAWLAEEHRQLIKFSNSRTIYEYVEREKLPDFMGGTCKRSYTSPPENCTTLEQATKLWGIEPEVVKKILLKFAQFLPPETLAKVAEDNNESANNHQDDEYEDANDCEDNRLDGDQDSDQENKGF